MLAVPSLGDVKFPHLWDGRIGISLATYAYPHIGALLVRDISVSNVLQVLEPIWSGEKARTETASRMRNRRSAQRRRHSNWCRQGICLNFKN